MKDVLKRLFSIVSIFLVTIFVSYGLNYFVTDDSHSYTRIMIHQLNNSDSNIDVLFVGASHCYRSLDPEIADKYFNATTFNAGSSGQFMDGSLAIIKEALRHNNVKKIFLEVSYSIIESEKFKERNTLTSTYLLSDYMDPSLEKVDYLLNASSYEHYINSFFPTKRNAENLFDFNGVYKKIQRKNTNDYNNYQWNKSFYNDEYYVDRGYVETTKTYSQTYISERAFGEIDCVKKLDDKTDWMKSLSEIIDLCRERNIELTFFVAPDRERTIIGKGNYQDFYLKTKEYAQKYNIDFFDFNLCKKSFFDSDNNDYFGDEDHLNYKGAIEFTKLFSRFFTGNISEQDLFYESFDKKKDAISPNVYGIAKNSICSEDGQAMYLICNKKKLIECNVSIIPDGKNEYTVPLKAADEVFYVPSDSHGKINVQWREKGKTNMYKFSGVY